jgi:hypothetical protein
MTTTKKQENFSEKAQDNREEARSSSHEKTSSASSNKNQQEAGRMGAEARWDTQGDSHSKSSHRESTDDKGSEAAHKNKDERREDDSVQRRSSNRPVENDDLHDVVKSPLFKMLKLFVQTVEQNAGRGQGSRHERDSHVSSDRRSSPEREHEVDDRERSEQQSKDRRRSHESDRDKKDHEESNRSHSGGDSLHALRK